MSDSRRKPKITMLILSLLIVELQLFIIVYMF